MPKERYLLDACGLFLFFQLIKPEQTYSKLKPTPRLKNIYLKFIVKQVELGIPILALWEFAYKFWSKCPDEFNLAVEIIEELKNDPSIEILDYNFSSFKSTLNFYTFISREDLLRKLKTNKFSNIDVFDKLIYNTAKANNYDKIISKDKIFDKIYYLERIW